MEEIKAAQSLVECLDAEEITCVFGLPGSQILDIIDALYNHPRIRFIQVRHEQTAAFMADAYALATHRPSVCLATLGPGATNLVTGIAAAYKASSPVIAITGKGEISLHQKDYFQEIDEVAIFKPITKWSYMVTSANQIPAVIRKAFRISLAGRPGPVHISIPSNLLRQKILAGNLPPSAYRDVARNSWTEVKEDLYSMLTQLLKEAKRPVVFCGGQILWEDAVPLLIQIVETLNIPAVTTVNHFDAFPSSHPLGMGALSGSGWKSAREVISNADLVLNIGAHFDYLSTNFKENLLSKGAKVVHISSTPEPIGLVYPVTLGAVVSIKTFLQSWLSYLVSHPGISFDPTWATKIKEGWLLARQRRAESKARDYPIHPDFAAWEIAKNIPVGGSVALDGGNFAKYLRQTLTTVQPGTFINADDFGTVGSAYPLALGWQLAFPNRQTVAILGDGAWGMTMAELETAIREHLPVKAIIFNDQGYGNIRAYQKYVFGERYIGCNFNNPDFGQIAALFGAWGYQVKSPEDLEPALKEMFAHPGPAVLDILVDPNELGTPTHSPEVN